MKRYALHGALPAALLALVPAVLFLWGSAFAIGLAGLWFARASVLVCLLLPWRVSAMGYTPYATFFLPLAAVFIPCVLLRFPLSPLTGLLCFTGAVFSSQLGAERFKRSCKG